MRLHRLISILLIVENKGSIKARELAEKLEISQRTVYRDIETLCEAGIPLLTTKGPNGGIRLMDGYSGGLATLDDADMTSLFLGSLGIQPDKSSELSIKLNNALMKLQKSLPEDKEAALNHIGSRFFFDNTPWWGAQNSNSHIDIMIHCIVKNEKIHICYADMNGTLSARDVDPYGIVVKRADWYLVGYCSHSKAMRIFKCDRIESLESLGKTFPMPADFSIEQFWTDHETSFKRLCADKEVFPVTVRLPKEKLFLLQDLDLYELSEEPLKAREISMPPENIFVLATVNMFQDEFAFEKIMSNASLLEVISPDGLREKIHSELQRIAQIYSCNSNC